MPRWGVTSVALKDLPVLPDRPKRFADSPLGRAAAQRTGISRSPSLVPLQPQMRAQLCRTLNVAMAVIARLVLDTPPPFVPIVPGALYALYCSLLAS